MRAHAAAPDASHPAARASAARLTAINRAVAVGLRRPGSPPLRGRDVFGYIRATFGRLAPTR